MTAFDDAWEALPHSDPAPLSLMGCYVAMRLSEGQAGSDPALDEVLDEFRQCIDNSIDFRHFVRDACSGMPDTLMPFRRELLDIQYAAIMAQYSKRDWRIFGLDSRINAGFFNFPELVHHGRTPMYHDTDPDRGGKPIFQEEPLLEPERVQRLLNAFGTVRGDQFRLRVPDSGTHLLELHAGNMHRPDRAEPVVDSRVSLIRLPDPVSLQIGVRSGTAVNVGAMPLHRTEWGFQIVAPRLEHTMELQAASLESCWLLIESARFRALARLPDLLEPGQSVQAFIEPRQAFVQYLGGENNVAVRVRRSVALAAMRRWPWLAVPNPYWWADLVRDLEARP